MNLLDFFKKKKETIEKPEKPEKMEKPEKADIGSLPKAIKKKLSDKVVKILVSPHITEKATALTEENKYVFKVLSEANKIEIKKAIEGLYGVDVTGVNIINVPRRQRRLGRQMGWRKGYKKAIVKIKKGQKIEILPR